MWLALLLVGCNRHWMKPGVEPVQVEKDFYECKKENTSYEESSSVNNTGARSSKGMRVNQELADACMRARGYTLEKVRKQQGPREPAEPQSRFEVEVGMSGGASFGQESAAVHTYDGVARQLSGTEVGARTLVGPSLGGGIGATFRIAPVFDLFVTFGGQSATRSGDARLEVDPADLDNDSGVGGRGFGSGLSLVGGFDARLRLPFFRQLYAVAGLRGHTLPPVPAYSEEGYIDLYDEETDAFFDDNIEVTNPRAGGGFIPVVRAGIGVDLLYARPHGLRTDCVAELLPISGRRGAATRDGQALGFSCRLSWVFALGGNSD